MKLKLMLVLTGAIALTVSTTSLAVKGRICSGAAAFLGGTIAPQL